MILVEVGDNKTVTSALMHKIVYRDHSYVIGISIEGDTMIA